MVWIKLLAVFYVLLPDESKFYNNYNNYNNYKNIIYLIYSKYIIYASDSASGSCSGSASGSASGSDKKIVSTVAISQLLCNPVDI